MDLIKRQDAIEKLEYFCMVKALEDQNHPSAEVGTQMSSADLISRQDAIDVVNAYMGLSAVSRTIQNMMSVQEILERLPSAERQGKWIDRSDGGRIKYPWYESYECNQCGHEGCGAWEYCPRCGARMEGE